MGGVLPSQYADGWTPAPAAVGVYGEKEGLLYVASPYAHYPTGATNTVLDPLLGATLMVTNLPCVIEGSPNLLGWETLGTVTNFTGAVVWKDVGTSGHAQRYYRARLGN